MGELTKEERDQLSKEIGSLRVNCFPPLKTVLEQVMNFQDLVIALRSLLDTYRSVLDPVLICAIEALIRGNYNVAATLDFERENFKGPIFEVLLRAIKDCETSSREGKKCSCSSSESDDGFLSCKM